MKIAFVGHGYVGLVTAAVFADFGNEVFVIGHTKKKVEDLKRGIIPFYEPGLSELVKKNIEAKRLNFTLDYTPSVPESDAVFIAVGTPATLTGDADLSTVLEVAQEIGKNLEGYTVVATKSTVPTGTNKKVQKILEEAKPRGAEVDYASVPEFLREGSAISDTMNPDRVVIGTESARAQEVLIKLHEPIGAPILLTNFETAELIKYASNSFLALKISYANAIAKLSELVGADALKVLEGLGMDKRIGNMFLAPGPGYGGSCFPKDVKALISIAKDNDYAFSLLEEVENINHQARRDIVRKARKILGDVRGKKIGIFGLAFKPNTDDMRYAPSIDIITMLTNDGAKITAFDPKAHNNAKDVLSNIAYADDMYSVSDDADLLILLTEWNEFREINFNEIKKRMKALNIIDGRNIYDPEQLRALGFNYVGVGR
ncbi:MAG: UDP-glucose 6-dehydrogenase [Candidatus Levybacteria bacterium RIFCSPHIGHO2_02_FULL_40_18]|nr:MAG: UDP-glucose 6-dehydrogenase [Candidatus Levybacteria bacterium RIFCSPHIGHO2_01_FULL_40_58]OGH26471.1 MAG: UDP-glucose 6-dehydrogenase [Candidatus Levybacteria bacterium RIFCSPHIGHO2_02_FULL_40_18]OGH31919.1 MAG: UDP-glucose 6-dehydrogenase [Candidatus Levybacteria bacterium RIFCSPHIGHO2_12_FULL_40_31]OGH40188.1 MAG: UDP-glucose 6-dehydrogenase [Candidatus Levybacteria bacterium RIFCSPLOWO2_01_FULL_40_64]OGH49312.1 MAG: UDP-glucose 6-dehydrogenase [Candidatus Levybacteria bacterium RIFCS